MKPQRLYVVLSFGTALLFSLTFTVNLLYHATVVRLTPLQLVLVGTILEATVFLCEVPTGVLADVKSRRLSIIVGYVLIGAGFLLEASVPRFWSVALAQVLWGLGYTFTSGATQAWIADEVGDQEAGRAFLRGTQAAQAGGLIAIPLSVWAGQASIRLPIALSGGGMLLLALFLALTMGEHGYKPAPTTLAKSVGAAVGTLRGASRLVRGQPVLLTLLGIGLFVGMYSEGFDRLETVHLLRDFSLPGIERVGQVAWFGALNGIGALLSLGAARLAERGLGRAQPAAIGRVLTVSVALIAATLAGFGLARPVWLAVACLWLLGALRTVRQPLFDAWFNSRIGEPQVRATLFSVASQVDALGQIGGGPLVGIIGNRSLRAALVASALILLPALPLHVVAARRTGLVGPEVT